MLSGQCFSIYGLYTSIYSVFGKMQTRTISRLYVFNAVKCTLQASGCTFSTMSNIYGRVFLQKIVNGFYQLNIFANNFIINTLQVPKYPSEMGCFLRNCGIFLQMWCFLRNCVRLHILHGLQSFTRSFVSNS